MEQHLISNYKMYIDLENKIIQKKEEYFPFDVLGRSLSFNSFNPRLYYKEELSNIFSTHKKCIKIYSKQLQETLSKSKIDNDSSFKNLKNEKEYEFVLFSETDERKEIVKTKKLENIESNLDLIATLRHLTPFYIIHEGIIISKYQILESAIAGSDLIVLDTLFLDIKKLNELMEFSLHLGLVPIIKSRKKIDLRKILRLKLALDCIYIPKDLIKFTPNNFIIFSEEECNGVNVNIYYL